MNLFKVILHIYILYIIYIKLNSILAVYYVVQHSCFLLFFNNIETMDLKLTLVINLTFFGEPELSRTKMRPCFFQKNLSFNSFFNSDIQHWRDTEAPFFTNHPLKNPKVVTAVRHPIVLQVIELQLIEVQQMEVSIFRPQRQMNRSTVPFFAKDPPNEQTRWLVGWNAPCKNLKRYVASQNGSFPPIGVKISKEIWYLKPPPDDQMNVWRFRSGFTFFEGFAKALASVQRSSCSEQRCFLKVFQIRWQNSSPEPKLPDVKGKKNTEQK